MRPNYRILSIYLLGVFIGALDTNVLGPAFRFIASSYHVSLATTAWTITAYSVAYVASTALSGGLGDRFGHRRLFAAGVALFGLASLLAASAPTLGIFLLARAVQGAGAGAVYPNAQAEGLAQFPPEKKGMALGMFGAVFGVASILGPNIGGALTQFLGWPTIFLLNVPLAVVALVGIRGLPDLSPGTKRGMPDWRGGSGFALLLVLGLLTISTHVVALRVVFGLGALASLFWFLRRQRRAPIPFLDSRPLVNRTGIFLMIGAALIGLDMASAVFVPAMAQRDLGLGALASGFALMPAAFSGAILAGAGGVMVDRIGAQKVLVMGLLAAAGGGVLLAWPPLIWSRFIVAMVLLGVGTAFTMGAPLNRLGLALYREDQSAEALALMAVFRSVGMAAGPILLTIAEVWRGFTGMYAEVAVASLCGVGLFMLVPGQVASRGQPLPPVEPTRPGAQ